MSSDANSDQIQGRARRRSIRPSARVATFGLVTALAVVGSFLSFSTLSGASDAHGNDSHKNAAPPATDIAESKKTSFGVVAVEHVEQLKGLSAKDLSGANHGVQNLVSVGQLQLQVSISVTNQTAKTTNYSPAQFRLRTGNEDKRLETQSSTFGEGTLQPHANIEGRLGFVVPADGRNLTLEFLDTGGTVIVINLGDAKTIATLPSDEQSHGGSSTGAHQAASSATPAPNAAAGPAEDHSTHDHKHEDKGH